MDDNGCPRAAAPDERRVRTRGEPASVAIAEGPEADRSLRTDDGKGTEPVLLLVLMCVSFFG